MGTKYEMELWESEKRFDDAGKLAHHPLYSRYTREPDSYGHITFSGHKLAESPLLQDVKAFGLNFYSAPPEPYDYERQDWANPIRAQALISLIPENFCWYFSVIGDVKDEKDDTKWVSITELIKKEHLDPNGLAYTTIKSENLWWRQAKKNDFIDRFFFESPKSLIEEILKGYWSLSVPGHTIQGFLMPEKSIDQLNKWNNRERDDQLFDEVMDFVDICFYTFPAENHDIAFLTRNYSFDEFSEKINFPELERMVSSY